MEQIITPNTLVEIGEQINDINSSIGDSLKEILQSELDLQNSLQNTNSKLEQVIPILDQIKNKIDDLQNLEISNSNSQSLPNLSNIVSGLNLIVDALDEEGGYLFDIQNQLGNLLQSVSDAYNENQNKQNEQNQPANDSALDFKDFYEREASLGATISNHYDNVLEKIDAFIEELTSKKENNKSTPIQENDTEQNGNPSTEEKEPSKLRILPIAALSGLASGINTAAEVATDKNYLLADLVSFIPFIGPGLSEIFTKMLSADEELQNSEAQFNAITGGNASVGSLTNLGLSQAQSYEAASALYRSNVRSGLSESVSFQYGWGLNPDIVNSLLSSVRQDKSESPGTALGVDYLNRMASSISSTQVRGYAPEFLNLLVDINKEQLATLGTTDSLLNGKLIASLTNLGKNMQDPSRIAAIIKAIYQGTKSPTNFQQKAFQIQTMQQIFPNASLEEIMRKLENPFGITFVENGVTKSFYDKYFENIENLAGGNSDLAKMLAYSTFLPNLQANQIESMFEGYNPIYRHNVQNKGNRRYKIIKKKIKLLKDKKIVIGDKTLTPEELGAIREQLDRAKAYWDRIEKPLYVNYEIEPGDSERYSDIPKEGYVPVAQRPREEVEKERRLDYQDIIIDSLGLGEAYPDPNEEVFTLQDLASNILNGVEKTETEEDRLVEVPIESTPEGHDKSLIRQDSSNSFGRGANGWSASMQQQRTAEMTNLWARAARETGVEDLQFDVSDKAMEIGQTMIDYLNTFVNQGFIEGTSRVFSDFFSFITDRVDSFLGN